MLTQARLKERLDELEVKILQLERVYIHCDDKDERELAIEIVDLEEEADFLREAITGD